MDTIAQVWKFAKFMECVKKLLFLTIGAIITAFALESFLVPNNIIDGGVIGISMIVSHITKLNLGLLILIINTPFIIMAFKKMGAKFVVQTVYANIILAVFLNLFHHYKVTGDLLLSTVFGGIILGFGVGVILKTGA